MAVSLQSLFLATSVLVIFFFFFTYPGKSDGQQLPEPLSAPSRIPFVGHIYGLIRSKFYYYVQLSRKISSPVFTMKLPGQKIYVVTSPDLIQAVQKQPKSLAFMPIAAKFANIACAPSPKAQKILMDSVGAHDGEGFANEISDAMRAALKPGAALDGMNRLMVQSVAMSLDNLILEPDKTTNLRLYEWIRENVTGATTHSIYGEQNPFLQKENIRAFWQYESGLDSILLGVLPSAKTRLAAAGRTKMVQALEAYFHAGGHEHASALMQNRYETSAKNGISAKDIAHYEVIVAIAAIVNTVPASFWMLLLIYAHPGLLEDIRAEIGAVVSETKDGSSTTKTLDITSLKSACPLLTSTYQEALRYRAIGTAARQVMEDTALTGRWLLKKGSMIQMPSSVTHTDPSIWGSDADSFNPRRFMRDKASKTGESKNAPAVAFRAFGGGTTLCPGRHFATNEILAVVTMFVMRYDMTPLSGEWTLPTVEKTNFTSVILEPDVDVDVRVSRRRGFEEDRWSFRLRTSDEVFAVVAEDRAEQAGAVL